MSICYIIGAGELPLIYINDKKSLIIAADGGLASAKDITPDIVVGDFDSLGYVPTFVNTVVLPTDKDVTDMKYAADLAVKEGYKTLVIYGGTGGRPDHTFANIALLCELSKWGVTAYLVGDGFMTTAITNSCFKLPHKYDGTVSVFAAGDKAEGVTIKGLKYTLQNHVLIFTNPIGVSNSFIGEDAEISVENGTAIIMWEENNLKDFIDKLCL